MNEKGWICPICGRALAPWVSECPCYTQPVSISTQYGRSWSRTNTGKCSRICDYKTDLGYCQFTACIKPEYDGDPNYVVKWSMNNERID